MPKGIYKRSEKLKTKQIIQILRDGKKTRFKKGHKINVGKHWKVEDTTKMSESHLGKPSPRKGVVLSKFTKSKISDSKNGKPNYKLRGEKSHFWKGGITPKNMMIRRSLEYKLWRESVFKRDNYTCIFCNLRGGWNKELKKRIILNADHIKPFALYPELRLAIDNGRTLCKECHQKCETTGINQFKSLTIKIWRDNLKIYDRTNPSNQEDSALHAVQSTSTDYSAETSTTN